MSNQASPSRPPLSPTSPAESPTELFPGSESGEGSSSIPVTPSDLETTDLENIPLVSPVPSDPGKISPVTPPSPAPSPAPAAATSDPYLDVPVPGVLPLGRIQLQPPPLPKRTLSQPLPVGVIRPPKVVPPRRPQDPQQLLRPKHPPKARPKNKPKQKARPQPRAKESPPQFPKGIPPLP